MRKTASPRFGSRFLIGLTFLFLYAPIFILIIFSFNAGASSSVWKGFSLHWYGELFHNRLILQSIYTTLLVSLLATVVAKAIYRRRCFRAQADENKGGYDVYPCP